jgi:hypothetical protein
VKFLLQTAAAATCINEDNLIKEEATLGPTLLRNRHLPKFITKSTGKARKRTSSIKKP